MARTINLIPPIGNVNPIAENPAHSRNAIREIHPYTIATTSIIVNKTVIILPTT